MRGNTHAKATIAIDAELGLHVLVRPVNASASADVADVGALVRASDPASLVGAVCALQPLLGVSRAVVLEPGEALARLGDGRISPRIPALMHEECALLQRSFARHRKGARGLPSIEEVMATRTQLVIEPLIEWVVVANLIVSSLATSIGNVLPPGYNITERKGCLLVPVCRDPAYRRLSPLRKPLDDSSLPLLSRLAESSIVSLKRGNDNSKELFLAAKGDLSRARELLALASDSVLSNWEMCYEGRLVRRPFGSASQLWESATSTRDVRAYFCHNCGRIAVASTRGVGSLYCSNACRAEAGRLSGRWGSNDVPRST